MPQEPINYTTGQPNATPFVPGSEYVSPVPDKPEKEGPSDEEYMKGRAKENVKRMTPKPPSMYRSMRQLRNGGLNRALRLPEGKEIPADRLAKARESKNEHVKHMANFAGKEK